MKLSIALVLGALLVLGTHAARMPELHLVEEDLPESVVSFQASSGVQATESAGDNELDLGFPASSLYSSLEDVLQEPELNDKKKWPIRIATKHLVKPDLHGSFVRQFWRFQYKSKGIKGLKYLSLSKVAGDNIVWTSYAVYEDFEALIKHARSEALRDFASYLTTANVAASTKLIFRIAGGYYGDKSNNALATVDKKPRHTLRLLTFYVVRPGEHCSFVKAWKKMEEKIGGSKGLIALTLNKPAGDNLVFTSWAHLESGKDLWALGEKKAVKEFKEYVAEHHIPVAIKKVWKIPEPKW
jgi:hypothetical protein